MGLAIEVGILADLRENDEDGFEEFDKQFKLINKFLTANGIPAYTEPIEIGEEVLSFEMWGYSGLHYLRRFAAILAATGEMPTPGNDDAADDPILQKYYANNGSTSEKYKHLIIHSDAEGYYLPIDFSDVLFPSDEWEIDGDGMIGSSYRLLEECEELAKYLELPTDIDPESDDVWDSADAQGEGDLIWKRYGVESFVCLRLLLAAKFSIRTGSAIVFC